MAHGVIQQPHLSYHLSYRQGIGRNWNFVANSCSSNIIFSVSTSNLKLSYYIEYLNFVNVRSPYQSKYIGSSMLINSHSIDYETSESTTGEVFAPQLPEPRGQFADGRQRHNEHIEASTKWLPCRRRHFQIIFLVRSRCVVIHVPNSPIDNKAALV